jgi:hypothetical protein
MLCLAQTEIQDPGQTHDDARRPPRSAAAHHIAVASDDDDDFAPAINFKRQTLDDGDVGRLTTSKL